MDPPKDFKSLQEAIQKTLVSTVKTTNRLAAEDLSFQRTVNPDVAEQLDDTTTRFLELSTRLLRSASNAFGIKAPTLEDVEDVDTNWRAVVDVVDSVLEKADTALDEYTGLVKRKEPPNSDPGPTAKKPKSTAKVIRNANVSKPQLKFDLQPDNFPKGPWKPLLSKKPNAKVPLDKSLVTFTNEKGQTQYKHPYETEISQMNYPDRIYETAEPIPSQPAETTQATWVDTYEGVLDMLEDLKEAKEIAVDLEHHDFRTYTGLVCLMQVSTREKDWIVDTLQPWRHKLEVLNEVFADPSIVKVFHGAYMDMIWLQRDLGLYVNGLFDTFFACEILYSGRSLAFLLSKFVDFDADKQYQLADWRIRPIPEEMLYYARSDTHYLLYIYDRVRNDLVEASDRNDPEKDHIGRALQKSKELSLSRHEHPYFDDQTGEGTRGWYNYVFKHSHLAYNSEQFAVFRAIWKWRDDTAREVDESTNFILGTHNVVEIARVNPPDSKALHSLLPLTAPLARARFTEVWARIQQAKAQGGTSLLHFFTSLAPDSVVKSSAPRIAAKSTPLPDVGEDATVKSFPRSQLFGGMQISSRWDNSKKIENEQNDKLPFPFPWQKFIEDATNGENLRYAQESFTSGEVLNKVDSPVVNAPTLHTEAEDLDEEFTLKRGRKRKSEAVEEEESKSSEEESESDSDEQMEDDAQQVIQVTSRPRKDPTIPNKKERRRIKRAEQKEQAKKVEAQQLEAKLARKAKKEEKRREKQGRQDKVKKYEAVPFDYSKASSVMYTKMDPNAEVDNPQKQVFDPYAKTGDNPIKAARRAPPVRGERSMTFKK